MFHDGRGQRFGRGRGWNQEGRWLQQRKRKLEVLPEMFEKQDTEAVRNSHSQWHGALGENSFRGSWFVPGFRNYQPNPSRWNSQESHRRRFHANEVYRAHKEDQGNQRQQHTTSRNQGEDHQQKNYMQRHETRTGTARGRNDLLYLSKTMSYLLRHEALKVGLRMQSDGYVFVSDLLQCKVLRGPFMEDDVRKVTEDNDKQRFQLKIDPISKKLMVRANQGHTIQVPHLELESILDASEVPDVVHGTFLDIWPTIQQQGLSRMSCNHIHFALRKPGEAISGMRRNCQVLVYINISKALEDGLQFFRSANNVILSPGDENGFISPKYFDHVEYRLTGKNETMNGLDSKTPTNSSECQTEESRETKKRRKENETTG